MAQGCHLIYSSEDRKHFALHSRPERSREAATAAALAALGLEPDCRDERIFSFDQGMLTIDQGWAAVAGVHSDEIDLFHDRYTQFDSECKAVIGRIATTKTGCQRDLLKGLGNSELDPEVALQVPRSLDTILRHSHAAPGLFSGVRKYESSWLSHLKNPARGRADGIAYEVNATAALIRDPIRNAADSRLGIEVFDKLYFGVKFQASYGSPGPIETTDREKPALFQQPFRRTVEADLLILRGTTEIGVDFKHTTYGNPSRVSPEQIEGVVVAIQTGEVDQFCFVTNHEFDPSTVTCIREANERLYESGNPAIEMFEYVKA